MTTQDKLDMALSDLAGALEALDRVPQKMRGEEYEALRGICACLATLGGVVHEMVNRKEGK